MEAGSVAFATDGSGWYELANASGSEIKQFTWHLPAVMRARVALRVA
ncbi:hypothetical protein H4W31_003962 [Plantactinospora soyae]|uniref:Uncharacterized protein n=1 Tax=Plantactinospora soyae TaxID=1544732 RepID=A0A927R6D3_9ACTN|nr:hypothetical protein [Plantactinospora soyae]